MAYSRLGDQNRARQDLERSTELLPTSTAMNELGKIALNNNNRNQAKQYFQTAAGGGGAAATEAALAFTRLDMVDNPGNYVQVQTFTDDQGRVRARVSNQAGIPVTNIQIEFTAAIDGELELRDLRVNSLGANQSVNLNTGLRFPEGVQVTSNLLRVRVTGVQAAQ